MTAYAATGPPTGSNYPFLALKLYRMASSQAPHPHTVNPCYQYIILVVGSSLQRSPGCILPAGTKEGQFYGGKPPSEGRSTSPRASGHPGRSLRRWGGFGGYLRGRARVPAEGKSRGSGALSSQVPLHPPQKAPLLP